MDRVFKFFRRTPDIHESNKELEKIASEHCVTQTQIDFYTRLPDFDANVRYIAENMDPNDPIKVENLRQFLRGMPEQKMLVYAKRIGQSLQQIQDERKRN